MNTPKQQIEKSGLCKRKSKMIGDEKIFFALRLAELILQKWIYHQK